MDLEFIVNNQVLKRTDSNKPANWSDNYLGLVFTFESDDWTGLNKYCLLRVSGELYRVELDNDSVTLPVGVLTSDRLIITLYGTDNEDYRITTNMVSIILGKSGYNIEDIGDIPDIEDIYALIESKASTKYVNEQLLLKADTLHTHSKSDITDFTHTHTKSDITNFSHTHTKNEITDFAHDHDNRYYTESEVDTKLNGKSNTGHKHTESDITDLQDYALVSDVPTKTSDLVNDVPFLTQHQDITGKADKTYVDTELNKKADKTSIPTKTSQLTNDSGFITQHQDISGKADKSYVDSELELKADITDVPTKTSDLTNDVPFLTEHQSLEQYYLKSEVDELIHNMNNKFIIKSDKNIIETGDTVDLLAKIKEDGFPVASTMIHFFEKISPIISLSSSAQVIETGDDTEVYARVRDTEDGSYVVNTKVHFFEVVTN